MDLKEHLHTHLTQLVRDRDPYLATPGYFYVQQYIHQQPQTTDFDWRSL